MLHRTTAQISHFNGRSYTCKKRIILILLNFILIVQNVLGLSYCLTELVLLFFSFLLSGSTSSLLVWIYPASSNWKSWPETEVETSATSTLLLLFPQNWARKYKIWKKSQIIHLLKCTDYGVSVGCPEARTTDRSWGRTDIPSELTFPYLGDQAGDTTK